MSTQEISDTPTSKCRNEYYTADSMKTISEAILEACIEELRREAEFSQSDMNDQMSITTSYRNYSPIDTTIDLKSTITALHNHRSLYQLFCRQIS